jgi:hypothetical protein
MRSEYTTTAEVLPYLEAMLRNWGFTEDAEQTEDLQKSRATAHGAALRLGSVRAVVLQLHGCEPDIIFDGPPSGMSPVERLLYNTPIPGTQRPVVSLLRSKEAVHRQAQAEREARGRKALAEQFAGQAEEQRRRSQRAEAWRVRAGDVAGIEARLANAGWEFVVGGDGLPVWQFGDATVAIREAAGAFGMSLIVLSGLPGASFTAGHRLVTSGPEQIYPIEPGQVEARPIRKSVSAADESADIILNASESNLRRAIGRLSKAHRRALRSLAEAEWS